MRRNPLIERVDMPKKSKKTKPVDLDTDETIEDYSHGSLKNGDIPPTSIAAAIADTLRDNPYANVPTDELEELARKLYQATLQLRLVERVLQARHSVW
jgi:hypothetical protein